MKKENIYKFLYLLSVLTFLGFIIRIGADYFKESITTSLLVERALTFLLPSVIILIGALISKKYFVTKS